MPRTPPADLVSRAFAGAPLAIQADGGPTPAGGPGAPRFRGRATRDGGVRRRARRTRRRPDPPCAALAEGAVLPDHGTVVARVRPRLCEWRAGDPRRPLPSAAGGLEQQHRPPEVAGAGRDAALDRPAGVAGGGAAGVGVRRPADPQRVAALEGS